MKNEKIYLNREISWLSFNHRVLQEARDTAVPLYEKIKFMAIFSSNLDEFFRVRVAALRNLLALKVKTQKKLKFDPGALLHQIHQNVQVQQEELGDTYRKIILNELKANKIHLIREDEANEEQKKFINNYFDQEIYPFIQPIFLFKDKVTYFLQNNALYLAAKLYTQTSEKSKSQRPRYAVIEIPTRVLPRFISLPQENDNYYIMFLDDAIRLCLDKIFPGYHIDSAYAIKLTRDAEIYIDDEFSGDLVEKIRKGISRRKTGVPSRFLYDLKMPKPFLQFICSALHLSEEDLVPGGRYHNFSDFFFFPNPSDTNLQYEKLLPLDEDYFSGKKSIFEEISRQDILRHYPYHSYKPVIDFLNCSAEDPEVTAIYISLYRVASGSQIVNSLIRAVNNGKHVTVFVEVKARFDEESNIKWAEEMKNAGVNVLYSFPGLKVHAKLCLVCKEKESFAYLATGNFNEKTAGIYTDFGLFTARKSITNEVKRVFDYLINQKSDINFNTLLVAPFNMRDRFYDLIENEINNAQNGKKAAITLKLNSLEDKKIINKLYKASQAGVKITLIIRGICCLVPGIKNLSENITAFSIIDRYLEHTRIYMFHNLGRKKYFLGSADWMGRNLNRRIETAFPVLDPEIKKQIDTVINIQLCDNSKARIISAELKNTYRTSESEEISNTQIDTYEYFRSLQM